MARYTGPIQKKLRTLGLESYGVYGARKDKRANQGFVRRRRTSAYGLQLKEKQKAKFLYGVLENNSGTITTKPRFKMELPAII